MRAAGLVYGIPSTRPGRLSCLSQKQVDPELSRLAVRADRELASQQTATESSTAPARPTLNLPADPITRDHRARPSLRHVSNPTPRVVWRQASETSGTCLEPADRPSTDPHSWAGRRLWVRGRAGRERLSLGLNHNSPSQSSISQFPIVHREQVNRPQPSINLDL